MHKHTLKNTHTRALCIDSQKGNAVVQDQSIWLVSYRRRNPSMCVCVHTHTHTHTHTPDQAHKIEPSIFQQYIQSTINKNSELVFKGSYFNSKDAHLGYKYTYIF